MSGNPRKHFKNTLKYFFQNKILDPQNIGQNIFKNDQKKQVMKFFFLGNIIVVYYPFKSFSSCDSLLC